MGRRRQRGQRTHGFNTAALTGAKWFDECLGKGIRWTPSGTARRSLIQFSGVISGTLYARSSSTSSRHRVRVAAGRAFDSSTSQTVQSATRLLRQQRFAGPRQKASTPGATASIGSGTHFVVLRYTFTATTTDTVDFWVNPGSATFGAGAPPVATGSTSGGNNVASITYFGLYAASGSGPTIYLDEVRLGTDWASVTPPSGSVVVTPSPAPKFTQSNIIGGNLIPARHQRPGQCELRNHRHDKSFFCRWRNGA